MTKAFNLLDEPWIPVRTRSGDVRDVGLLDALLHASEYAGLAETSPPNLIALYRLLLAITHRALTTQHGPWRDADRASWFREGLPDSALRNYLEHWREHFWLFHPEHPFMQVAALAEAPETKDKFKSWTQVALEGASGNTPVVFDHAMDAMPVTIPYRQATRNLLGFLQFTPGGLVKTFRDSDKAGPLANTSAVVPAGSRLAETLLLGLHPYLAHSKEDLPAWELSPLIVADLKSDAKLPTGPNDRYTRLTRAVLFAANEQSEQVSRLRFGAGLALGDDMNTPDPMACYRINKDGKSIRISFHEGRAVWRDLPSLLPDMSGKFDLPPAVLGWATNLYNAIGQWDIAVPVLCAGLASDQAKLLRWRAERIELPPALLANPDAAATLRQQMQRCEDTYFRLRGICSEMIAGTMPDPEQKDTRSRARAIQERGPAAGAFFSTTERALPQLMQTIAAGEIDAAHRDWSATLVAASEIAWEATRRSLGLSTAVLRAEARAYPRFRRLLRSLAAKTDSTAEEIPS